MAENTTVKKYLDQAGLETLVGQIKSKDAATLQSAKDYADSLAINYDESGAASTAESNAKKYADEKVKELSDGQVTTNKNDIAAIKADYLKSTDKAALEGAISDLETYVGTIPDDATATDVIGYVDEKTSGIANDSDVKALADRVAAAETNIDNIQADYLKAADKTELSNAITTEKNRAEGIEQGLRTDVDAIKGDYLKAADKTALEGKIKTAQDKADAAQTYAEGVASDLSSAKTALETADTAQVNRIKSLEDQIVGLSGAMHFEGVKDALPTDVSGYESGDVIIVGNKEYVFNGTEFAEFGDVTAVSQAITALEGRMTTAEGEIDTLQTDLDAAEAAIATKASQADLTAEVNARTEADTALSERITTLETAIGDSGSVANDIATAKAEAIAAAADDATTKANQALADAKTYADGKVKDLADGQVATNASEISSIKDTIGTVAEDKTVVQMIADAQKAATYDDTAIKADIKANADAITALTTTHNTDKTALQASIDKVAGDLTTESNRAKAAEEANADAISALTTTHNEDKATLQAAIDANTSAINSFARISEDEITAMFA